MRKIIILILSIITIQSMSQHFGPSDILGNWMSETNDICINIYENDDKYYGKIIWTKIENDENIGKVIIKYLTFNHKKDKWSGGSIDNLYNNNTYNCSIKLKTKDHLKLKSFIGWAPPKATNWIKDDSELMKKLALEVFEDKECVLEKMEENYDK